VPAALREGPRGGNGCGDPRSRTPPRAGRRGAPVSVVITSGCSLRWPSYAERHCARSATAPEAGRSGFPASRMCTYSTPAARSAVAKAVRRNSGRWLHARSRTSTSRSTPALTSVETEFVGLATLVANAEDLRRRDDVRGHPRPRASCRGATTFGAENESISPKLNRVERKLPRKKNTSFLSRSRRRFISAMTFSSRFGSRASLR
jgi:hypothetical protein